MPIEVDGTEFQCEVWASLRKIPFGQTISYADLAKNVGRPNAFRAVGMASGKNPLPIILPCHRVVGSRGTLTGYSGGLQKKLFLLEHEGKFLQGISL